MISPEEVIEKINNVNHDSVAEIIDMIFDKNKMSVAAVGAVKSVDELFCIV